MDGNAQTHMQWMNEDRVQLIISGGGTGFLFLKWTLIFPASQKSLINEVSMDSVFFNKKKKKGGPKGKKIEH